MAIGQVDTLTYVVAPEALVQAERDKLAANQTKLTALDARIADLKQ